MLETCPPSVSLARTKKYLQYLEEEIASDRLSGFSLGEKPKAVYVF